MAGVGAMLGFWYQAASLPGTSFTFFKHPIEQTTDLHQAYSMDKGFYDIFFIGQQQKEKIKEPVFSAVLPHHLIAGQVIGSFFNSLEDQDFDTIVIVGPNHKQLGNAIISDGQAWQTPYGVVSVDKKLFSKTVDQGAVSVNSRVLGEEHSISALVPFVKKTWPRATIMPIIVKDNAGVAELDKLVNIIAESKRKVLFIASVDFSHYLSQTVADFHDELSRSVLKSGSTQSLQKTEIDSQPSLYALLKYNESKKAQHFTEAAHTNSARIIGKDLEETTSHFIGYYTEGLPVEKPSVSIQFFGDIMLDRHVALNMGNSGLEYIFAKLQGQENRFFYGATMYIANLEGPFASERVSTSKSIAFRFDPKYASQLKGYGFSAFNLANNHAYDMGAKNVAFTREVLAKNQLGYFGDEYNEGSEYVYIAGTDQNLPFNIAFVGLNDTEGGVNMTKVQRSIDEAKQKSKFVIVNIHWGEEYQRKSNAKQQKIAHQLIDWGADIIIGHHPHVIQEVEVYNNHYIFYSLGNFIFDQYFSKETQEGMSVGLVLEDSGEIKAHIIPFFSHKSQVQVMLGKEKSRLFDWLIENSRLGDKKIENIP